MLFCCKHRPYEIILYFSYLYFLTRQHLNATFSLRNTDFNILIHQSLEEIQFLWLDAKHALTFQFSQLIAVFCLSLLQR